MKEASYYQSMEGSIQCLLCPHNCQIKPGALGVCGVRENRQGTLVSLVYGKLSAINIDPIEKKPLYHFYPGSKILSLGSYGCNLSCLHCQNHQISQNNVSQKATGERETTPQMILSYLKDDHCGIAYTYNEPIVWIEYVLECASRVRERGKKNVFVSNGYINQKALEDLIPVIDAFSIDLKGFTEGFYRKICHGSLNPVLESLKTINRSSSHLEVDFLVIPGLNDDLKNFDALLDWYTDHLGASVPLHINRYFPHHRMTEPATPVKTIEDLYQRASERLDYVYAGNMGIAWDNQRTKEKKEL